MSEKENRSECVPTGLFRFAIPFTQADKAAGYCASPVIRLVFDSIKNVKLPVELKIDIAQGARRAFCFDLNSTTQDSCLFRLNNNAGKGIQRLFCPDFDRMLWDSRPFLSDNDIGKSTKRASDFDFDNMI